MPSEDLYTSLKTVADNLIAEATTIIDWSTYKNSPPTIKSTVLLKNTDFDKGTLRITSGNCVFKITEDITIEPGTWPNFQPEEGDVEFPRPPYQLGWFAGITCETTDPVVIDLNGFTIEQSELFALQQRFYAIIEINDRPFLDGQGPSAFGVHGLISGVTIVNGILGRSSHHGIHSPGNLTNILIENVQIQNFEVGGIHLNGATNTVIKNCNIGPIRRDVPVLGTYSQCIFIKPFVQSIDPTVKLSFKKGEVSAGEILADLEAVMSRALENIAGGREVDYNFPAASFLANSKSPGEAQEDQELWNKEDRYQPSGGAYGIVLNKSGIAVNGFLMAQPDFGVSNSNILVENTCINLIKARTVEVVGLNNPGAVCDGSYGGGGAYQTGPVGDVFRIDDLTGPGGVYKGTVLSNAQILVAVHGGGNKGTTSIHSDIIDWALSGSKTAGVQDINTIVSNEGYIHRLYNGDAMAHVCKGNIGIFLQGGKDIEIRNSEVSEVIQNSDESLGSRHDYDMGQAHPESRLPYYGGGTSRGIAVASCSEVKLVDTKISMIRSLKSNAIGIDYIGVNTAINTQDVCIQALDCNIRENKESGDQKPVCCPMRLRDTTSRDQLTITGKCPALIVDSS